MGNKGKKAHVYDHTLQRSLQGIVLPPKIKCDRCGKHQVHGKFSFKQLNEARLAIYERGQNATYKIKCRPCTGGQVFEIECTVCNVTKSLEAFAKIQRTKPDQAKCYDCVEKQLDTDPVNEEVYEKATTAFVPLDSSAGNYPEYWSNNNTSRPTASHGDDDWNSDGEDGGVRLDGMLSQMALSTNRTGTGTVTLIDTNSKAFGSNMTERSETRNGWAKIKAYKPEKKPTPQPDDDWKSESEDDTNDIGDDDDDEDFTI